jgi:CubicO group peptidase (beta-lactamase class C family)
MFPSADRGTDVLRRRVAFAPLAAGLTLAGCASVPSAPSADQAFTFRDGMGFRAVGPDPERSSAPLIRPIPATTANFWHSRVAPDAFSRMDELFGASRSRPADSPAPLGRVTQEPGIAYRPRDAGRLTIDDYMNRNPVTGLLIAQADRILVERYQYGRSDQARMTSFSMAKTVIALLIGIAVENGQIASIDDRADRYVTGLAGTEYGATPLRALLTMSSGVRFREEYQPDDDVARLSRLTWRREGMGGPAALRAFNQRVARPGERWSYASSETFVLALVLRASTGQSVAEFFEQRVWRPLGAEAEASWLTDATGQEVGYMGLNARVRDFARLAMMMARGGTARGQRIVSPHWIQAMTRVAFTGQQTGRWFGYGYQTWVFPDPEWGWAMLGVRGQSLFVDPKRELVLVNTAARAMSRDPGGADTVALWIALRSTISPVRTR